MQTANILTSAVRELFVVEVMTMDIIIASRQHSLRPLDAKRPRDLDYDKPSQKSPAAEVPRDVRLRRTAENVTSTADGQRKPVATAY